MQYRKTDHCFVAFLIANYTAAAAQAREEGGCVEGNNKQEKVRVARGTGGGGVGGGDGCD